MFPHLLQVNVSAGGVPKRPIERGRVTLSRIEGDDWNDRKHHGLPGQAVLLFSSELLEELRHEGYPVFPGALGENLTTRALDYRALRPGDVLSIGPHVEIRITKVRVPCRTLAVYGEEILRTLYDDQVRSGDVTSPKWGRSGFYAEVLKEGWVRPGDPIEQRQLQGGIS